MTRLKIDITNGIVEAEGEEAFVQAVFTEYKGMFHAANINAALAPAPAKRSSEAPASGAKADAETATTGAAKSKPAGKKRGKESHSIIKDLDLSSNGGKPGLREFATEKGATSAIDKNAVFVYYLKKHVGVKAVTPDHVYSCYKHMGERVPTALRQSLLDTASRKGLIDTKSMTDITIGTVGDNFVEHDLPKAASKAKK